MKVLWSKEGIHIRGAQHECILSTRETASAPHFSSLHKQADWLYAAAFGDQWRDVAPFDKDTLLDSLRGQVKQYSDGEVLLPACDASEEFDPIDSIGCELSSSDASPSKTKGQGAKRTRYYKNLDIEKVPQTEVSL